MKTAEEFRNSFGKTDDGFRRCIRQTLMDLEREEELPVKKKMSLGLVLAVVIIVLTAGAFAASQFGIIDFANKYGEPADESRVITQVDQSIFHVAGPYFPPTEGVGTTHPERTSHWVDITLEELMYDDGWLFASVLVKPRQESTMVIADSMETIGEESGQPYLYLFGHLQDINQPGTMQRFTTGTELDPETSVREYADAKGFEHVVRVALGMFIKHADYQLLEDGSLRMLVQMEYNYQPKENYPDQLMFAHIPFIVSQYDENGLASQNEYDYEHIDLEAVGPIIRDKRTKTSIPADAHDIEGYRGYIESVSVTPISDDTASVILQLDKESRHFGVTQMSGPVVVILDENGETLREYHLYTEIDSMTSLTGDRIQHNILVPRDGLPEDRITIRLQSWRNSTIIYDEYTYTLE